MLNFFYRALNSKKGFTLIEVLVVVAIIGILAALAAPRIIGRIDDARRSSDESLAKTIETALAQYIIDKEMNETGKVTFPESLAEFFDDIVEKAVVEDQAAEPPVQGKDAVTAFEKYFDASTRTLLTSYQTAQSTGDENIFEDNKFQARILFINYNPLNGAVTTSTE